MGHLKDEEKSKKETGELSDKSSMRTAFIRISETNVARKDYPELGIKEGDIINYTKEDIINILEEWAKTKDMDYFLIEHYKNEDNPHMHIVINFTRSQANFKQVKQHFPFGDIEVCGKFLKSKGADASGNSFNAVCQCVNYLTHETTGAIADGKEKYDWDEIVTNAPSMLEVYKNGYKKSKKKLLDMYIEKISKGELREYEIYKIDPAIYAQYKNRIHNGFEQYKKTYIEKNKDRDVTVYFLEGPAGFGKTTFCKAWAEKHNKSYSLSQSGKHATESYRGEDIFVLDDADFKDISIDFLKALLENNSSRELEVRYEKTVFMGDTIMICSNISVLDLYPKADDRSKEAIYRRIKLVLKFEAFDDKKYVAHYSVNTIYKKSDEEYEEDLRKIREKRFGNLLESDVSMEELLDSLKRRYVFKKIGEKDFDLKPYLPEIKNKDEDIKMILNELDAMGCTDK